MTYGRPMSKVSRRQVSWIGEVFEITALSGIWPAHRKSAGLGGGGHGLADADRRANQRQGGGIAVTPRGRAAPGNRVPLTERGKSAQVSDFSADGGKRGKLETPADTGAGGGSTAKNPGRGYVYRWGGAGRKGEICVVTARGSMNSRRVEFKDGFQMITSGNALARIH